MNQLSAHFIAQTRFYKASGTISCVAVSSCGSLIAAGQVIRLTSPILLTISQRGSRGTVQVWDNSRKQCVAKLDDHVSGVRAIAFSPDERLLASIDGAGNVYLWNIASQKQAGASSTRQNVCV